MKEINLKLLYTDLRKVLNEVVTSGEEIVITKRGKPYISIRSCNLKLELRNKKEAEVVTSQENVVTSKQEVIQELRKKTEEILEKPKEPEKVIYCEACKKIRRNVPAVEKCEVYTGEGMAEERWLCAWHRQKIAV